MISIIIIYAETVNFFLNHIFYSCFCTVSGAFLPSFVTDYMMTFEIKKKKCGQD